MTRRSLCWITASAAAIAALAALVLGALQSVAWRGLEAPALARWIALRLDPGLGFEPASQLLAQPSESYFGYGRLAIAIYLLLGLVLAMGRPLWRSLLGPALAVGVAALLAVAAGGDIAAYWFSEGAGPFVRRVGFWFVEVPALALAIALVTGAGAFGWADGKAKRSLALALLLALPLALVATALLAYMPHGPLLGLALTLALTLAVSPALSPARVAPHDAAGVRPLLAPGGRTLVAVTVALACVGTGFALALYRPVLLAGPAIDAMPLPETDRLDGARLHVFNTGYNRMSWWLVGRERPWRPVPAFVVEDPQTGLFVFDTGFSDAVARNGEDGLHAPERWVIESRSHPRLALPAQMLEAGLDPARVHHVALSHLHGDHVGQIGAFPNAAILGGPGSANFAHADSAPADSADWGERWQELSFEEELRFGAFEPAVDFIGDGGIVLVFDGGHAAEGMMLLLALDGGPVLLTGDAVVHLDWLRSNDVQRIVVDPVRAATVRNQVRAFIEATPGASVAYGHDLRAIDCDRRDIVCHPSPSFRPEELATPQIEALLSDFVRRQPRAN